jgi:DHA2 family multidrug resistance protein
MTDAALSPAMLPASQVTAYDRNALATTLGFAGMVLGQFMAILDIQIVTASLTQIQNGIGASADEMSWVQTIYLLAEVVIMPLTAYMTRLWGTRNTFVVCCLGFVITSIGTGLSSSIEMMIVMRALQGLAAGAMIPAVFATAFTVFPVEKRAMVNVVMGLVITMAPTIGPTLGGHLTELASWRWLFFINVPTGLVALVMVWRWGNFDKGDPSLASGVDWAGLISLTVFVISMQYVLEEGAKVSWFKDDSVLWLTVLSVLTFLIFLYRQLTYRQPILSLQPFQDGNFRIGVVLILVSGVSLFGGTFVIPLFLAQVLHYSAATVGTTMFVSGITMFFASPIAGWIIRRVDPRLPMFAGFLLAALGIGFGSHINERWGYWQFAGMQIVRGIGTMLAMIASQTLTISTMPPRLMKDASALISVLRNIGGAIGLAGISTILTTMTASHYADLTSSISITSQGLPAMMAGMGHLMGGSMDSQGAGRKAMALYMAQKAHAQAFADVFYWLAVGCGVMALAGLLAKPSKAMPEMEGH